MNRPALLADFWPPLLGGLVAVAAALLVRTLAGTRLVAEISLDAMLSIMPGQDFSSLLGAFGPYGKALFFFSVLLAQLALYVLVWMRVRQYAGANAATSRVAIGSGLLASLIFLILAAVLIAITTSTLGHDTGWLDFAFATVMFSAIYAGVAAMQLLGGFGETESSVENDSRRRLLRLIPGVALGGLAILVIGRALNDASGGGVQRSRSGEATPEVTPTNEFYVISKNLLDPEPNGSTWRLRVGGATERTLTLNYEDMLAMPSQEQYTTMQCISNDVGGELIGNALWRGVSLSTVIQQAGPLPTAHHVFLRCVDEYSDSIPIDFAMRPQTILAYQMNGEPLTHKHGFPIRLLTPGKYGMKHPKWIIDIELMEDEQLGFWQRRGWSQEAPMNTTVRIDVPGAGSRRAPGGVLVRGMAFSGDRGISKVEVSTDRGESWHEATLKPPLSTYTWILWEYDWANPPTGDNLVLARATDGTGQLQMADSYDPYPDGAAAYHDVEFKIESGSA